MFSSVQEEALFPSYVWIHDLEEARAVRLNQQLFADLDRMTAPRPKLGPGQNWQTDQTLHHYQEAAELVGVIESAVTDILARMELEHDGFEMTALWANINPRGAPHPPHFHPNNFLSGVYYVQTPPGADSITFHEPRTQVDIIAPHLKRYTRYSAPHQDVPVKPGRLVVFPAWLSHSVKQNRSEHLRISVSFNIMLKDYVARQSRPRWQGIPLKGGTPLKE